MTAQLLEGEPLALGIRNELKSTIAHYQHAINPHLKPGLAVIQVGENPASQIYVARKRRACAEVGIESFAYELTEDIAQSDLLDFIHTLNHDSQVHGILVQLPLPRHIDVCAVLKAVNPRKDVDGFHPYNMGCLMQGRPLLRSCTPYGIMQLLSSVDVQLRGLQAVVVGASTIVGRPMALELLLAEATVTICHDKTVDLSSYVKRAQLLVVSIGNPTIIQGDWIRPGAIVVDVGINRLSDGRVIGDVPFETASRQAAWITPVPGGVGPMTVAALLQNTWQATCDIEGLSSIAA